MFAALAAALLLQQTPDPPAPAEAEAGERPICRMQAGSGTRFSRRVCLTQTEWASYREALERHRQLVRPTVDNRRPFPGPGRSG